jgi:hypothetical protein
LTALRPERDLHRMRDAGRWMLWLAAVIGVPGAMLRSPLLLSIATAVCGFAFVAVDMARLRRGGLEPITVFAGYLAVTGVANTAGFWSIAHHSNSRYLLYAVPEYFPLASLLLLVGGIMTVVGYTMVRMLPTARAAVASLPGVRARLGDRAVVVGGTVVALIGMATNFLPRQVGLGTLGALLLIAPDIAIFVIARLGFAGGPRYASVVAVVLTIMEAIRAALFAYLRATIILPLFAFAVGALIGARSLRVLRSRFLLPIYVAAAVFAMFFATLGRARAIGGSGLDRIAAFEQVAATQGSDAAARTNLLVRLTSFNQLSQIGRLVKEDGFLHGATLEYLAYAFVPRFLWPDKPKIAKGAWFAYRIGLAYVKRDGNYSNSINMTVPGELYLNFGWMGVVTGCLFFGALLATLWSRSGFWQSPSNTLGTGYGFYLFWVAFGLGADLQLGVTLIAVYLVFVGLSVAVRVCRPAKRADPVTRHVGASPPTGLGASNTY